ncbi:MAG: OmpA family protein [Desulfovibrionaceae bacterium]|nr:OmpA family protein [Desulfovibrionaceae bacterium]
MLKLARLSLMLLIVGAAFVISGCGISVDEPLPPAAGRAPAAHADASALPAAMADAIKVIESTNIYFAFDRYDLSSASQAALKVKADLLKRYPTLNAKIEGYCDNRGTENYNLALGERRAKAVYDYVVMQGVQPSQISVISYGQMYPAVAGNNEAAWSQNRRVEFKTSVK